MGIRASDDDRADVADLLRESAAEGRLTIDELSERISEVMSSKTYADLHGCLRELPSYESYRPWHKVKAANIEVVGANAYRRKAGLSIFVPLIFGIGAIALLMAMSGLVASVILMPLQIILDIVLVIIAIRVIRFFLTHLRH